MSSIIKLSLKDISQRYHLTQREIMLYIKPAGMPLRKGKNGWYVWRWQLSAWEKKHRRIPMGKGQYYTLNTTDYHSASRRQKKTVREYQRAQQGRKSHLSGEDWLLVIKWGLIFTVCIVCFCGLFSTIMNNLS